VCVVRAGAGGQTTDAVEDSICTWSCDALLRTRLNVVCPSHAVTKSSKCVTVCGVRTNDKDEAN
jgi:hypothetical protein